MAQNKEDGKAVWPFPTGGSTVLPEANDDHSHYIGEVRAIPERAPIPLPDPDEK